MKQDAVLQEVDDDQDDQNPESDGSESGEDGRSRKRTRKQAGLAKPDDVIRTNQGIYLSNKNAFDFVEKPTSMAIASNAKKTSTSIDNLRKRMMKAKRQQKAPGGNTKMQTVKNDVC